MIHRILLTTFVILSVVAAITRAADAPASAPASAPATQAAKDSDVEVQEWLVLLCDPTQSHGNARALFTNTLPEFMGTRRPFAPEKERNEPRPIGVIRLIGPASDSLHTDVLLELKGGTFVAHWPKTQPRVNRLLWRNLAMADKAPLMSNLVEGHWLQPLREGASAYLTTDRGNDRFLLYDVELPYKAPVRLSAGTEKTASYNLANTSSSPLHDLSIYRPTGDSWAVGTLKQVAPSRATTKPTTTTSPATTQASTATTAAAESAERKVEEAKAAAEQIAIEVKAANGQVAEPEGSADAAESGQAATNPSTTQASSKPAASQPVGVEVKMASAASDALLEPWKQVLADAGLSATDHDLILSILRKQLNPRHATIIYRLDPGELDRLLPIEIIPAPKKTSRVALVVVRNVDPALIDEIDALIALLGDADWAKREQAFKDLAAFGAAAQPKLNTALKSKDVEVVFRAERLLAQLSKPNQPPQ